EDPLRTVLHLFFRGYSVAAVFGFTQETATDRCHISPFSKQLFIDTYGCEPAKKRFAGGPGKRLAELAFFGTGGLTYQHYLAQHGVMAHHRTDHQRAELAGVERFHMTFDQGLFLHEGEFLSHSTSF